MYISDPYKQKEANERLRKAREKHTIKTKKCKDFEPDKLLFIKTKFCKKANHCGMAKDEIFSEYESGYIYRCDGLFTKGAC